MGVTIFNPRSEDQYYRVLRQVNGKSVVRYFSKNAYDNALEFDAELAQQQKGVTAYSSKNQAALAPTALQTDTPCQALKPPKRTAVKGLQIGFQNQGYSKAPTRHYPCIVIAGSAPGKPAKRTCRLITPTTRTLAQAWAESCQLLATLQELASVPAHWLDAQPPPEQFIALVEYYRSQGKTLSDDVLDYLLQTSTASPPSTASTLYVTS